ncbi:two-component system, NarL family, capsular synthesis sensor histidine kinase RcsC [Pseudomonas cuatrocienegasensis]|uniref:histidine kinase n=1 Tax=Pseudomonas cuatrocienegasensis TaxID=543360 RepID=A0ABY1BPK4_9PSED|nr:MULTISPECIES: ATP-binding protein [Pseudomonas]OEC33757.1 hybrid sensor histidine kinase/response regulator [Pseudomonas sp. 21C1]SER31825.1 two-component system, NarL family, capsular synthesis sensor histidine kinase RcsC [Pseudomonas cuatrocienegasensis]
MKPIYPAQLIDTSFSTPKAAKKLLCLLALVFAVYAGAYSYLRAQLNEEVSIRRGYMNAALTQTQGFFVNQQVLLKSLSLSLIDASTAARSSIRPLPAEQVSIRLGSTPDNWSLVLTQRMLAYLREHNVKLLHVAQDGETDTSWLTTTHTAPEPLPRSLLQRLRARQTSQGVAENAWCLADPRNAALYIFTYLDSANPALGWLGLQLQTADLLAAAQHEKAGDFMLFDERGRLVISSATERQTPARMRLSAGSYFGWEGEHWLPDRLVIRKRLEYSQWQMAYSLELRTLLPALSSSLFFCLALCALATALMDYLVRRIDHGLIVPAANRLNALIESEAFNSAVIETAPVALCVLRRSDAEVVLENALSQRWLGNGQSRKQRCCTWIGRAFDGTDTGNSDEFETDDGRQLYLSFTPTRYHGEDVLICAFSDISARRHVERALEQARRAADEASEAKTLFLANVSHEIRTPLYGVLGTLELLGRTALSAQQKGYLTALEGSSKNLLHIISDVLDVSKIEAGQLSLELIIFSPIQLVQEVIHDYADAAQSKGLHVFACIDPQLPYQVKGDLPRIRQILSNLLSNAVKFTEHGRIVLHARLESREDERAMLQWQVVDTGKGIAPEDQHHLFDPFFQARCAPHIVAGTGLGLAICQRLMHLMNGQLQVVSEPGLGTSVTLCLPLEQVNEDPSAPWARPLLGESLYVVSPVQELSESIAGWLRRWGAKATVGVPKNAAPAASAVLVELQPGMVEPPSVSDWSGPRVIACAVAQATGLASQRCWQVNLNDLQALNHAVRLAQNPQHDELAADAEAAALRLDLRVLLAEDNVISQLILRDQLKELGCSVVVASDGVEALALWQAEPFDLILTDINMPNLNGYELTQALRQHGCSIPIIGATANALQGEGERCLAAGMDHCLTKPFTLRALYQCLHTQARRTP